LDPVILAFLLPTTLKRYCIQIFAARYFRELGRLAKLAREKKRVLQYFIQISIFYIILFYNILASGL